MATRQEVADRAGVSVAVVSYVLNNRQLVKEETRRKVLKAVEELGYRPNQTARSLKTKKSRQIAVFVDYIGNPFEAGLLLHIEAAAKRDHYFVSMLTYEADREEELRGLLMGRVDGILLLSNRFSPETEDFFRSAGVPVVTAIEPAAEREHGGKRALPCAGIDWLAAMRGLIAHLRGQGHEKLAFMTGGGPGHAYESRLAAFRRALELEWPAAGTPAVLDGGGRLEQAAREFGRLLDAAGDEPEFTAVVCANDLMAAGCLAACRERSVPVPERLAIAGCEDILMSSQLTPPLTAIHYPRREAGEAMMNLLLKRMNGEEAEPVLLAGTLVVRQST